MSEFTGAKRGRPKKEYSSAKARPATPPRLTPLAELVDKEVGEQDDRERKTPNATKLKWARFAEYYFDCGDAGEAYKMTGYSVTTEGSAQTGGSRLLNTPWVQAYLIRLHEGDGKPEQPVPLDENDKEILIADNDEIVIFLTQQMRNIHLPAKSRFEAAKELAKINGMYTEKIAITSDADIDARVREALGLDDEE